jgi:hypothetical protein
MYASCIRGSGVGFWKSTDGGVSWINHNVDAAAPGATGQQFYPPVVDPYDDGHLLMAGHGTDFLFQSFDGGESWTLVRTEPGMTAPGGTGGPEFVDTGDPATTRDTWLWLSAYTGGNTGTWRTSNGGSSWAKVDNNEHTHGSTQLFQPGGGVIFMAGNYSGLGAGVLRSTDYGVSWVHVGLAQEETIVFGTPNKLYAMFGWGIQPPGTVPPSLQVGDQPGTGSWSAPGTPAEMTLGPAQAAVTYDGKNYIILTANYGSGLWRYVEPAE